MWLIKFEIQCPMIVLSFWFDDCDWQCERRPIYTYRRASLGTLIDLSPVFVKPSRAAMSKLRRLNGMESPGGLMLVVTCWSGGESTYFGYNQIELSQSYVFICKHTSRISRFNFLLISGLAGGKSTPLSAFVRRQDIEGGNTKVNSCYLCPLYPIQLKHKSSGET